MDFNFFFFQFSEKKSGSGPSIHVYMYSSYKRLHEKCAKNEKKNFT